MERPSITRVPFHRLNAITLSGVTGQNTYAVNPQTAQLGALSEVGDQFDLFRCSRLKYRIHPMSASNTALQVGAYVPDVDIQTSSTVQLSESPIATCQSIFSGVPSQWINVPRAQLKGMLDWYKCTADSGAAEFESQGLLVFVGGLGEVLTFEVRGVMDFKNPVSTSVQMERVINHLVNDGKVVRIPQKEKEETPGIMTKTMHRTAT